MEASTFFEALGIGSLSGLVVACAVLWFSRTYLTGYLDAKGKNLATKEDIAEITKLVEDVKHQFSIDIEERRAKNLLRMAALDKRLQAHQEAFSLWRKLYFRMHVTSDEEVPEFRKIVATCEQWWDDNCLYLEPEARQAFSDAFYFASMYPTYLKMGKPELAQKNSEKVLKAGDVFLKAVQLPGLSEREKKVMPKVDSGA